MCSSRTTSSTSRKDCSDLNAVLLDATGALRGPFLFWRVQGWVGWPRCEQRSGGEGCLLRSCAGHHRAWSPSPLERESSRCRAMTPHMSGLRRHPSPPARDTTWQGEKEERRRLAAPLFLPYHRVRGGAG